MIVECECGLFTPPCGLTGLWPRFIGVRYRLSAFCIVRSPLREQYCSWSLYTAALIPGRIMFAKYYVRSLVETPQTNHRRNQDFLRGALSLLKMFLVVALKTAKRFQSIGLHDKLKRLNLWTLEERRNRADLIELNCTKDCPRLS